MTPGTEKKPSEPRSLSIAQFFSCKSTATALTDGGKTVSSEELISSTLSLASVIASYRQQSWALACDHAGNFIKGLLALLAAGKSICLPANSQPGTLCDVSRHAQILLTDGCATGFSGPTLSFSGVSSKVPGAATFHHQLDRSSLTFFTSGSSGQPKAIVKQLWQLEAEINALETLWGDELEAAQVLACVSHQHIYGVLFRILWPLLAQRPLDCEQYDYPEYLLTKIAKCDRVVIIASPAQLERLPGELDWSVCRGRVQAVFSSGAPLSASAANRADTLLTQLPLEVLGSTETGGVAWRQQPSQKVIEAAWRPLPGVSVQLNEGLLQAHSPWLDHPQSGFVMGDKAQLIDDQRFLLKGRADQIAKIEGKRVSLTEMSARLLSSPLVESAEMVVLEGKRTQIGAAIVLTREGHALLSNKGRLELSRTLKAALARHFETVTLPRKWRYLNCMPVNTQGKKLRSELIKLFTESSQVAGQEHV